MGPADRVSGHELPHREHPAVRQRRRQGHRRQAEDHGAPERIALQGPRDQARGAGRSGAGRRDPARQLLERRSALRPRRRAVPRDELCGCEEALCGLAQGARRQARRARNGGPVRGAMAAARRLLEEGAGERRRHERPEVAFVQPADRAHRRAGRRAAGDDPGSRGRAGARDRRDGLDDLLRARPATTRRSSST